MIYDYMTTYRVRTVYIFQFKMFTTMMITVIQFYLSGRFYCNWVVKSLSSMSNLCLDDLLKNVLGSVETRSRGVLTLQDQD